MGEALTSRQLAKEQTDRRIRQIALRQLAESGVGELSLRAVARELGLVSSAIYRYYASRDDLLTALILDAYQDLASSIRHYGGTAGTPRQAWVAGCGALRTWALAQPHRFSLLYGSVIPGYQAPQATVVPAAAVVAALVAPASHGVSAQGRPVSDILARQAERVARELDLGAEPVLTVTVAGAFAQLIGVLTLEIGGHLVGTFEPATALYDELVLRCADAMGLD